MKNLFALLQIAINIIVQNSFVNKMAWNFSKLNLQPELKLKYKSSSKQNFTETKNELRSSKEKMETSVALLEFSVQSASIFVEHPTFSSVNTVKQVSRYVYFSYFTQ